MRKNQIKTFFNPKQVCSSNIQDKSFSKSPLKPLLLLNHLKENGFEKMLDFESDFSPFTKNEFLLAHTKSYVNDFFQGGDLCESNNLPWSKELVESVTYTNSSLFHAIKYACENPDTITFSPTSGFHHATPNSGMGFCTFSGQVISSLKIYKEKGLVGAYLDLDGHFGNSIPDSIEFCPELKKAIKLNINPSSSHEEYLIDFQQNLTKLCDYIRNGEIDYVVWCHGADSHEWDDLGYQCTTSEWIQCSELFYSTMKSMEKEIGKEIPLTLSLFGGYRADDYESVLSLHASDLKCALSIMNNNKIEYETKVKARINNY